METPIKTVIVDDEPPAREIIMEYLIDTSDIDVVALFGSPAKALQYFSENKVDLLFLDIQMPQMTGFELVEQLDPIPEIIFSTAYDQYAIRAFELNAIDYLLKPYTKQRFEEALSRVRNKQESEEQPLDRIQSLVSQARGKKHFPARMFVRVGSNIVPVFVDDIIYVKADGDYSSIHTPEDNLLCSTGLGNLEDKLDPDKFMRVHRSYIVAIDKINNLKSDGGGGFTGVMTDGSEIKVSRSRAEKIKELLI